MTRRVLPVSLRAEAEFLRFGPRSFRLLNSRTGTQFELEAEERFLVELLSRNDSVAAIIRDYEAKFGVQLSPETIWEFIGQLQRLELIDQDDSTASKTDLQTVRAVLSSTVESRANLPADTGGLTGSPGISPANTSTMGNVTAQFPSQTLEIDPAHSARVNAAFDVLTLLFGWILHPIWLLPIVPLVVVAACILVRNWDQFCIESSMLWATYPFLELLLASYVQTQFLMNLPLAVVKGISCRHNCGRIRSFGIVYGKWVLPTASFSIDIGDALVLMAPRRRCVQISIGLLTPIVLASFYIIGWKTGSRASNLYLFWMCMVITSLVMIAIQFNPFSTFSTLHWALAWHVDDWRLHQRAIDETWAWFCGRRSPEPLGWRKRVGLRTYGVMAFLIRLILNIVMLIAGTYWLTKWFGSVGFAALILLVGWWNREHLRPLWAPPRTARFATREAR